MGMEWEFTGNGNYATIPFPFEKNFSRMAKEMSSAARDLETVKLERNSVISVMFKIWREQYIRNQIEWARAETGGADRGELNGGGFSWISSMQFPPDAWDTHYQ